MRRIGGVLGAVILVTLAIVCWNVGVTTGVFAAVPDGPPEFVATRYSGSWIATSAVCVLGAILLTVDAIRITVLGRPRTG